jgi:hypothetical protein
MKRLVPLLIFVVVFCYLSGSRAAPIQTKTQISGSIPYNFPAPHYLPFAQASEAGDMAEEPLTPSGNFAALVDQATAKAGKISQGPLKASKSIKDSLRSLGEPT